MNEILLWMDVRVVVYQEKLKKKYEEGKTQKSIKKSSKFEVDVKMLSIDDDEESKLFRIESMESTTEGLLPPDVYYKQFAKK
jgi:hypothetical protein